MLDTVNNVSDGVVLEATAAEFRDILDTTPVTPLTPPASDAATTIALSSADAANDPNGLATRLADFFRSTTGGPGWLAQRKFGTAAGGFSLTAAFISPYVPFTNTQGAIEYLGRNPVDPNSEGAPFKVAGAIGAGFAADMGKVDLQNGTWYFAIVGYGTMAQYTPNPTIVTYRPSDGRLELGTKLFDTLVGPTVLGAPVSLGITNWRVGVQTGGNQTDINGSLAAGLFVRNPVAEGLTAGISALLGLVADKMIPFGLNLLKTGNPVGAAFGAFGTLVGGLSKAGQFLTQDWKIYQGSLVSSGNFVLNTEDFNKSYIKVNSTVVTVDDIAAVVRPAFNSMAQGFSNLTALFSNEQAQITNRPIGPGLVNIANAAQALVVGPRTALASDEQLVNALAREYSENADGSLNEKELPFVYWGLRNTFASANVDRVARGIPAMTGTLLASYLENISKNPAWANERAVWNKNIQILVVNQYAAGGVPAAFLSSLRSSLIGAFNDEVAKDSKPNTTMGLINFMENLKANPAKAGTLFGSDVHDKVYTNAMYLRIYGYYYNSYKTVASQYNISNETFKDALFNFSKTVVDTYFNIERKNARPATIEGFEGLFYDIINKPQVAGLISNLSNQAAMSQYARSEGGDTISQYALAVAMYGAFDFAVNQGQLPNQLRGYVWVKDVTSGGSPQTMAGIRARAAEIEAGLRSNGQNSRALNGGDIDSAVIVASANLAGLSQNTANDIAVDLVTADDIEFDFTIGNQVAEIEFDALKPVSLATSESLDETPSLFAAGLIYSDSRTYDGFTDQAAIDEAERVYETFPDWTKTVLNNDFAAYTSTRTDILKPAATDAQRLAFRDAYLLEYSTSNNQTKAYAAAKLAAESLDSPVVFKYPVSLLREDAAATARVRMAGLLPAFTGLGTPIFTLSGADAAKFEVVNGGLYLKAGVVVDSAVQSQLDVTISVTYPDAGTKPSTWEGAWPPVGSSNFSAQVTARMVDLPAINGTPAAHTAPAGWWKGFGTPDIVAGNGVWPGESTVTVSDLSSPSPVGGSMALFLTTPDWNEGITTRLTGLVVGKTYSLPPMYWQQVSVMGDSSPFDGRSRFVVMVGGQTFTFEPNGGVGDDVWQTANVTFTATETTMLVSLKGSMKDGTPSVMVVDLDGPGNQAPTSVEFIDARRSISTSADMRSPSRVADIVVSDDDEGQNTISLSGPDAGLFEIRDNKLYLKAGVDLAALGRNGLSVTVDVQDTTVVGSAKVSNYLYIGLTTNKAPTAITLSSPVHTSNEDPARSSRRFVSGITITDDRSGRNANNPTFGTNNLTLSGADADMFEVETRVDDIGFVSHGLYLKAGVALDFEKKAAFNITVTVTDPDFPDAALSTNFTLNVRDTNDAPTDLKFNSFVPAITMASDLTVRTLVANLEATDDALGTNTFVLTGTDAAFFEVNDGKLYLKAGMPLNATTKPSLSVIVGVEDRNLREPAITKTLTIAVNNTNTAPTAVVLTPIVTRLDENTSTTTAQVLTALDIIDDGVGTNTITLTGANAAFFEVVGNRLMLKAGVVLDFETTPTLTVTVNVDDTGRGTGVDASTTYTLQVTNINEAPTELTFANLVTVTSSPTPLAARLLVADIVLADDALGTNAFYLRGADADKFEIIGSKLYLKAGITLDYLTKPNFTLTIVARDATISGSSELREQFRIEVAPPGGFASVYGQFIYDQTGADNGYIQWPDGRKQYVSFTESQTTGQIILTDKLTNRRINYFSAPDGEFYVKPPTVAVASTAAASVSAASVTPLVNGGYAPDYGRLLEDPLNTGSFFIQWPDGSKRDVTVYVDSIDGKTTLYAKDDPTRKTRFAISMGMDGKSYVAPENTRQPFMMAAE